jgi:hypothetical protein
VEREHPLDPADNARVMIAGVAGWAPADGGTLFGGGTLAEGEEGCELRTMAPHGWRPGMRVRLVVAALGAAHPLQGVHVIEAVPAPDRAVVRARAPPALAARDLRPGTYAPPSYGRRVPPPARDAAPPPARAPPWEALEEIVRAHPRGLGAIFASLPLDVPPSLRRAPPSAQHFWAAWAPPRAPSQVGAPPRRVQLVRGEGRGVST